MFPSHSWGLAPCQPQPSVLALAMVLGLMLSPFALAFFTPDHPPPSSLRDKGVRDRAFSSTSLSFSTSFNLTHLHFLAATKQAKAAPPPGSLP